MNLHSGPSRFSDASKHQELLERPLASESKSRYRPEADIAGAANRPFESPPSRRDSSHDDWDASAQFPFHDSVADFIHDQIFVVEQNRLRGAPPTVLLILRQILRRRRPAGEGI